MVGLSLTDVQYRCNLMEKIQIQAEMLVVVAWRDQQESLWRKSRALLSAAVIMTRTGLAEL